MDRLNQINTADSEYAVELLTPLIERAPHVARKVATLRPFESIDDLEMVIKHVLQELSENELIDLFNSHPELAPENPLTMTSSSQSEQARLNLASENDQAKYDLDALNARYRSKFGFPFITALVHHKDIDSVLLEFEDRLLLGKEAEIKNALVQVSLVSSARVQALLGTNSVDASNQRNQA